MIIPNDTYADFSTDWLTAVYRRMITRPEGILPEVKPVLEAELRSRGEYIAPDTYIGESSATPSTTASITLDGCTSACSTRGTTTGSPRP